LPDTVLGVLAVAVGTASGAVDTGWVGTGSSAIEPV
jgi:hypothetical protein